MKTKYELFEKIIKKIQGKNVLDVGCIDHKASKSEGDIWVHRFLYKNSRKVIGIDILREDIEILQKKGYNILYGNAENFKLKEKFEVIVAGELIEHLSNPGLFLNQCKKHLEKEGLLILTTPNTFNLYENIKNVILLKNNPPVNPEHTCYYSPTTIKELLKRYKFENIKIDYFDFYGSFIGKIRYNILNLLGDKFKRRMIIFAK